MMALKFYNAVKTSKTILQVMTAQVDGGGVGILFKSLVDFQAPIMCSTKLVWNVANMQLSFNTSRGVGHGLLQTPSRGTDSF